MQAFYIENFNFSEAGFIRINQIRTFSKHLFKKKSIPFSRYSSFYTNKNTHTWNKFMGASLSAKKKKKGTYLERCSFLQPFLHLPRSLHLITRKKPTINTETFPSAASFFSFGLLNINLPTTAFLQQHAHRANSRSPSPQICETPTSSSQQGCPS
jgi:hypothetical protein